MTFYVSIRGQSYGPASVEELEQWYKGGSFGPADFVWDEARNEWIEAIRSPAVKGIFKDLPRPAAGLEDLDELAPVERESQQEPEKVTARRCVNHEEKVSEVVCPKCSRPFCRACVGVLDGVDVCLDCIGQEKGASIAGWKSYLPWAGGILAIGGLVLGSTLFFSAKPPEQPVEPPRIALKLGDAPKLSEDGLTFDQREKMKRALAEIQDAIVLAREAGDTIPAENWVDHLVSGNFLPEAPAPVEGYEFRLPATAGLAELWTRDSAPRRVLVAQEKPPETPAPQ